MKDDKIAMMAPATDKEIGEAPCVQRGLPGYMPLPRPLEPVLAKVFGINSLGASIWHEVVYHDGERWRHYHGSTTFNDGETVKKWVYVSGCI